MNGRSRRGYLVVLAATAVAGCLGEDDAEPPEGSDDDDSESDNDDPGSDDGDSESDGVDEGTQGLAAEMAEAIDEELGVTGWRFEGQLYVPEYADGDGVDADIPVLAAAYADVVDAGFDHRSMPTARDADGDIEYMVFLEPEWGREYVAGELSESEYHAAISETEH